MVETRKAQAEARWASNTQSSCNSPEGQEVMVAADVHVPAAPRSAESTSLLPSDDTDHSNHSDRSNQANSRPNTALAPSLQSSNTAHRTPHKHHLTLSAARSQSIQRARVSSHSNLSPVSSNMCTPQTNTSLQSNRQTPVLTQTPENSLTPSSRNSNSNEPRRGLHFDSARQVAEVSSDEEDASPDDPVEDDHGHENQCCREQWLENKALRNRLQKLHRRLNIALKAKTSGEIEANRPSPGILDRTLAQEYKMVELIEGSGVFWYPHQRAYCSAYKGWTGYLNAAVDIFFSKDTLQDSCAKGQEHKSKNGGGRRALSPLIVEALIGKVCSKFSKEGPTPSQVVQKINMKCVEARRPPRV